ncbi:phosphoesterase RecJ domain protein [Spirochaeta thermophila DSM 6578]|uniref:Phosphoesterase RecJ domain protein n=1 Tax=Winmispira thermophila (strain ATCC 700085 / DSM 6578 / Z-1203) TaxID=869211 RepID=G0GC49_WINT7|nr:DHH family phosphoesterase [Spirochaeta thermophila]AEJ60413.1 phosphoesterase RecJ domain protein [Spirochaeta thermophila DSM 6578]
MRVSELLDVLVPGVPVCVLVHDYPDHDAVASAAGLVWLLSRRGWEAQVVYRGMLESESLKEALSRYPVPLSSLDGVDETSVQFVVVDGFYGSGHVPSVGGKVMGVIDHHEPEAFPPPEGIPFVDVRPSYGACASIVYEYLRDLDLSPPSWLATFLMLAILMDTEFLARGVSPAEMDALAGLYRKGDLSEATGILSNSLVIEDLPVLSGMWRRLELSPPGAFVFVDGPARSEVMAVMGDLILRFREITCVFLCARDGDGYRISVRSEDGRLPAWMVVRRVLEGYGVGGGHVHMGGGRVDAGVWPGEKAMRERFISVVKELV